MTRGDAGDRPTPVTSGEVPAAGRRGGLRLLVIADHGVTSQRLPDSGEVTIGRSRACTVAIEHDSVSRRHAVLRIASELYLEDCGSRHGTRIGDRRLVAGQAVRVQVGEPITLGELTVVIQRGHAAARPRRLWTHDYFEARVEDECARAGATGGQLAIVRVAVDGADREGPTTADELLAAELRAGDAMALYAPGEYELLLLDASPQVAAHVIERLRGAAAARGGALRAGAACFPRDGRTAPALMARAGQALRPPRLPDRPPPLVFEDPSMRALLAVVDRIAPADISVILLGETGAGKDVVARELHERSSRAGGPFLPINCAALPDSMIESELFGYDRGAFTGADQAKPGLLETARGGTVFLDEIGELPVTTQAKLLRVLEERSVLRLGGLKPQAIDVRFVCATNRDLEDEAERGAFRRDLYFRLNGVSLTVPPLRERLRDIAPLAGAFVEHAAAALGRRAAPALERAAIELLERYGWPGNVRELRNLMERAVLLCPGDTIAVAQLPLEKLSTRITMAPDRAQVGATDPAPAERGALELRAEIQELERRRILDALEHCGGNQTKAARLLGIPRGTLMTRLDEYGIPRPRKGG